MNAENADAFTGQLHFFQSAFKNDEMKIKGNFHTHTVFCDGSDTPEAMVLQAIHLGFTQLGFSGHMDADIHMDLPAYMAEIRRLQSVYADRIEILCGIELDNLYDLSCGKDADFVIGSTHFLDVPSKVPMSVDASEEQMRELCNEFFGGDYYALAKAYYELEALVYDRTKCDFVGHFDLVTRFNDSMRFLDESDPRYLKPALSAMEYLVSEGVPFEINCGAINRNRKSEPYPNRYLLKQLYEMGGEILINSDAHQKEKLNGCLEEAAGIAYDCGFREVSYLTRGADGRVVRKQWALF